MSIMAKYLGNWAYVPLKMRMLKVRATVLYWLFVSLRVLTCKLPTFPAPFLLFHREYLKYLLRVISENIAVVAYCINPKFLTDTTVILLCLFETLQSTLFHTNVDAFSC